MPPRPAPISAGRQDFDPRAYARRADWQLGEQEGVAEILVSERIAWQIERHFGRYGEVDAPGEDVDAGRARCSRPATRAPAPSSRGCSGWGRAPLLGPPELAGELGRRLQLLRERHSEAFHEELS